MIKQNQRKFNIVHVLVDAVSTFISVSASYFIAMHFQSSELEFIYTENPLKIFLYILLIIAIHLLFYSFFGLYRSYRTTRFLYEAFNILKANIGTFFSLEIFSLLSSDTFKLQLFLIVLFLTNTVIIVSYRFFLRRFLRYMRRKGYNKKFIVIMGINNCTQKFIENIRVNPDLGYEILGYFNDKPSENIKKPYLGNFKAVSRYLYHANQIDEVVLMTSDSSEPQLLEVYNSCERAGIKTSIIPNIFGTFSSRIYVSNFGSVPVMSFRKVPLDNKLNAFIKRLCDVVISIICIVLLSPLMLGVAIAIKFTSHGKVIFKQERIGFNRKKFVMYKFRSMKENSEITDKMTEKDDERCTRVGKFIRRFSIDELPQLFNVLIGNMSLVGPRPETPFFVKEFRKSIPQYMLKHYVKPGMTGWAQINGLRGGDTSIEERIKYDMYYIENWTLAFDIKILFMTLTKGIFSKNGY